jgi:hypothetical protein
MLSCNACHSVGTSLTAFGQAFKAGGFRVPLLTPRGDVPIAIRGQAVYSSDPDPSGLPKAIVDEIDVLSAAPIGKHFSYNSEVYIIDGGRIGSGREAWLEYDSGQRQAVPLSIRAGLQVLPIPVDPERFRETNAHYAVYDQTVGENPFTFFDPHNAVRFSAGHETNGFSASVLAVDPHDPQSTLPRGQLDTMIALQHATNESVFEIYRYAGSRLLPQDDRFQRTGYGFSSYHGRAALSMLLQRGFDSDAGDGNGGISSSGGFIQGRYQVGSQNFVIARYDGVNDSAGNFSRSMTLGAGTIFARAFRIEVEDSVTHQPETRNTFSIVLGFGVSTIHEGSFAY